MVNMFATPRQRVYVGVAIAAALAALAILVLARSAPAAPGMTDSRAPADATSIAEDFADLERAVEHDVAELVDQTGATGTPEARSDPPETAEGTAGAPVTDASAPTFIDGRRDAADDVSDDDAAQIRKDAAELAEDQAADGAGLEKELAEQQAALDAALAEDVAELEALLEDR